MTEHVNHFEPEPHKENSINAGRVLFLTKNQDLLRYQLSVGQLIDVPQDMLLDRVSTDEIIPNKPCLAWTGKEKNHLSNFLFTGLRNGGINPGEVMSGNFQTVVAGPSFARGSSRFHAPLALAEAGIRIIIAEPERIFEENAINAGIYVLPPAQDAARKILAGEYVDVSDLKTHLSRVSKDIMTAGGLIQYLTQLTKGEISYPSRDTTGRPMTMIEKMIARKTHVDNDRVGVSFVKPGDECIVQPDSYYGYELQTTAVRKVLTDRFGDRVKIQRPEKAFFFNDHTALIQSSDAAKIQQREQKEFADRFGIKNFENDENGSTAICHTKMIQDYALPGQIVLGNDSHTCTLGAVNTFAVGKGAADLAGALACDKMVVKTPESIRINLRGQLQNGATMKDFMLYFGAFPELKEELVGSGRVFEFGGEALDEVPFDEQLKLANMSVELQGFTGIIEPNQQMVSYLKKHRGITDQEVEVLFVKSDDDAEYFATFDIDLSIVEPTVATPGDTQNGKPLSEVRDQNIAIQKAYIGSCTHGTPEDLRQAAEVLRGRKVAEGVNLYVQASSIENLHEATEKGYIKDLMEAGAEVLLIGCGACMNAGPGSTEEGEVGIFATNRNFPGRTGPGQTYLANPAVTAASAVRGIICGPEDLN